MDNTEKNTFFIESETFTDIPYEPDNPQYIIVKYANVYSLPPMPIVIRNFRNTKEKFKYEFNLPNEKKKK